MLEKFKAYLRFLGMEDRPNFYKRTIAAASAGLDSVVLCHLLKESGNLAGIAHCNYGLRKQADEDEAFVAQMAEKLGVPFYPKKLPLRQYAKAWEITQQVAARRLRYAWLEEVRHISSTMYVASAFHGGEALELLFINLAKGHGPLGMAGPLPIVHRSVRPLMFASHIDILAYATEQGLEFRPNHREFQEDLLHEKVRQHVLPALELLNPHFVSGLRKSLERWHSTEQLLTDAIRQNIPSWDGRKSRIELPFSYYLKDHTMANEQTYLLLKDYGFTYEQAAKIWEQLQKRNLGYQSHDYFSPSHRAEVGYYLHLYPLDLTVVAIHDVKHSPVQLSNGILLLGIHKERPRYAYNVGQTVIYLDADKVSFPLELRRWRPEHQFHAGSSFTRPQTLATYFTNRKIRGTDRDNHWVLWSGDQICGVTGMEEDIRFAVSSQTKRLLSVTFHLHVNADEAY